jgi:hypothetical protein
MPIKLRDPAHWKQSDCHVEGYRFEKPSYSMAILIVLLVALERAMVPPPEPTPENYIGPVLRAVLERHFRYVDMSTRETLSRRT